MADLRLDFVVTPTYDNRTFNIVDTSTYPNDPPEVTEPLLEVSIPGFETVTGVFTPTDINIVDSLFLGISEVGEDLQPLPDGVYVFRYSVAPAYTTFVEKTIMRINHLQEKFDSAFMKLDMMQCDANIKREQKVALDTINYFIQGSIAAANNCATQDASRLYNKAFKMLDDFINRGLCCGTNLTRFY